MLTMKVGLLTVFLLSSFVVSSNATAARLNFSPSDSFVLPYSLISGYYSLSVVIRDPVNYRKPLPLAILGRSSDGSYLLSNLALTFRSYKAPNGALLN